MAIKQLFPTTIYVAPLMKRGFSALKKELLSDIQKIKAQDQDGQSWSKQNYPGGYTSYGSWDRLWELSSTFRELEAAIHIHVNVFAKSLDISIKKTPLHPTQMWVNVMQKSVAHSLHLHPLATVSGTVYLATPKGCGAIKFEDPRMTCFMASAPRKSSDHPMSQRFYRHSPKEGEVVLFESWIRHEVEANQSAQPRVSVSSNYNWF